MSDDIQIKTLDPFEIHPLPLARHLLATTPRWRWLRRRRLRREVDRLTERWNAELEAMSDEKDHR